MRIVIRHTFITFSLVLALASCRKEETPPVPIEQLYDDTLLPKLTLSVSEKEWNRLLECYDRDNHTEEYIYCDVSLLRNGEEHTLSEAGLRLKGNTSRRRPEGYEGEKHSPSSKRWRRCHFVINSDYFKEKDFQTLLGYDKIVLKYCKEDPTYVREHYCCDLAKRYGVWTISSSSFCRLFLQVGDDPAPKYFGVYLMMEGIGKEYITTREDGFGSDKGFLWRCRWGANLRDEDSNRMGVDNGKQKEEKPYMLKTGEESFLVAKQQLKRFIHNLNNLQGVEFEQWLESVCDVNLLLKTYAMLVALGHWDDYWNDMNNTYIYFNSRDAESYEFFMIPYDFDNTLGTSQNCGVQTDSGRQDPYHWGLSECTLMSRILQVARYRRIYTEYLKDFAVSGGSLFGWKASQERIQRWQDLIRDYIPNDTGEDMEIIDKPASWGNHSEYRIMSYGADNWFKVKSESLEQWTSK